MIYVTLILFVVPFAGQRRVPSTYGDITAVRHSLPRQLARRHPLAGVRQPEAQEAVPEEGEGGVRAPHARLGPRPPGQNAGPRPHQEDLGHGGAQV